MLDALRDRKGADVDSSHPARRAQHLHGSGQLRGQRGRHGRGRMREPCTARLA